jgi:hypothetical protein
MKMFGLLFFSLLSLASSAVKSQVAKGESGYVICRTHSNGIPFSDGATNLKSARLRTINICDVDDRTSNNECRRNMTCENTGAF